jgi:hypothetical protein
VIGRLADAFGFSVPSTPARNICSRADTAEHQIVPPPAHRVPQVSTLRPGSRRTQQGHLRRHDSGQAPV